MGKEKDVVDAVIRHRYEFPRYGTRKIVLGKLKEFDGEAVEKLFAEDEEAPHTDDDGYQIHDEWYADDEEMQKAIGVFKEMLGIK